MDEPKNLLDVSEMYFKYIYQTRNVKTAKNITNETQSALTRFLIVGFGYEQINVSPKMTKQDVDAAKNFMKTILIKDLMFVSEALEKGLEKVAVSKLSRNTYSARINQFIIWGKQQLWWPREELDRKNKRTEYCPKMRKGNGRVNTQKLTERTKVYSTYKLQPQEISLVLRAELKNFYEYLTEPEWPGRLTKAITDSSAQTYLEDIRLMLGWFYRYQKIPLENLSLNILIPHITFEEIDNLSENNKTLYWSEKKVAVDTWICNYFKFLREELAALSPRGKKFKINALSALAKFQYCQEVVNINDYGNIPVIKVINKHGRAIRKEVKNWDHQKRYIVKLDKKWPELLLEKTALFSVRKQILEPLRLECRYKNDNWHKRDGSAIAASLARYLVWSFLADMPARRQEEYRSLKIALSCPIMRPSDVPSDGLYHPLPPNDMREKHYDGSLGDNYIYKTYAYKNSNYDDGIWILNICSYKTVKIYGSQSIVIPNRRFADGSCLYDYIERYLYGWWLPKVGKNQQVYDWWQSHLKGQYGQWVTSGRAVFNPGDACCINHQTNSPFWSWGYFFVKPLVGIPYGSDNFQDLIAIAAHRLTGKRLSPHTMRYVWATWAYQVGLSDQQRESLAYAMGHDVKTMREMYERCTPDEKRRPIEEAIDELLFNTLPCQTTQSSSTVDLEKLALELLQLPEADIQNLKQQLLD